MAPQLKSMSRNDTVVTSNDRRGFRWFASSAGCGLLFVLGFKSVAVPVSKRLRDNGIFPRTAGVTPTIQSTSFAFPVFTIETHRCGAEQLVRTNDNTLYDLLHCNIIGPS